MNTTDLIIDREIPTGTINGSNQVFNLANPPDPVESLQLILNGKLQTVGEDYSIVDVKITFVEAPPSGSILFADYRYSLIIISTSKIGDVDGSSLNNDEAWTDDTNANLAQATADGKIVTFIQAAAPTAEGVGDLWIDSDDGNKLYRWSGSAWTEVQDSDIATAITNAATAQSTADSKTDDTAANAAQATADGKIVTFIQATAPTAEGVGDLWIDSDDGNKLYRWSGSAWTEVQDSDIAQAITDAATAQSTADSKTDDTAADAAQATADGKIVTFFQSEAPTAEGAGDLWIDTNDNNKPYRWSGSAWVEIDNPVSDWSLVVDDDGHRPANDATNNTGNLADLDTVDSDEIDDGAILLEKLSAEKSMLFCSFESMDAWEQTVAAIVNDLGGVRIATSSSLNNVAEIHVAGYRIGLDWSKDFFWQSLVKTQVLTSQVIYFGLGGTDDIVESRSSVGFYISNGTLYCYHAKDDGAGGDLVYTTQVITGITLTDWNVYRFKYDQSAGTLKFYVNGVLKYTFSSGLPASNIDSDPSVMFQVKTTTTSTRYLYINDLIISSDR